MKYDAMYFLQKFYDIPDSKWMVGEFKNDIGQFCALGHCGVTTKGRTYEGTGLGLMIAQKLRIGVVGINDGKNGIALSLGSTPKERIMNALYLINAGVEL